jgi:hypothetical protein
LIAKKEAEEKRQAELDLLQNFNDDACDLLLKSLDGELDPLKILESVPLSVPCSCACFFGAY